MSHFDAPSRDAMSGSDRSEGSRASASALLAPIAPSITLEENLAQVIRSARDIAASAEELLRELAVQQQVMHTGRGTFKPIPVVQALQPLDATRERLISALERLRPN